MACPAEANHAAPHARAGRPASHSPRGHPRHVRPPRGLLPLRGRRRRRVRPCHARARRSCASGRPAPQTSPCPGAARPRRASGRRPAPQAASAAHTPSGASKHTGTQVVVGAVQWDGRARAHAARLCPERTLHGRNTNHRAHSVPYGMPHRAVMASHGLHGCDAHPAPDTHPRTRHQALAAHNSTQACGDRWLGTLPPRPLRLPTHSHPPPPLTHTAAGRWSHPPNTSTPAATTHSHSQADSIQPPVNCQLHPTTNGACQLPTANRPRASRS